VPARHDRRGIGPRGCWPPSSRPLRVRATSPGRRANRPPGGSDRSDRYLCRRQGEVRHVCWPPSSRPLRVRATSPGRRANRPPGGSDRSDRSLCRRQGEVRHVCWPPSSRPLRVRATSPGRRANRPPGGSDRSDRYLCAGKGRCVTSVGPLRPGHSVSGPLPPDGGLTAHLGEAIDLIATSAQARGGASRLLAPFVPATPCPGHFPRTAGYRPPGGSDRSDRSLCRRQGEVAVPGRHGRRGLDLTATARLRLRPHEIQFDDGAAAWWDL
jgi:hypothetical protein